MYFTNVIGTRLGLISNTTGTLIFLLKIMQYDTYRNKMLTKIFFSKLKFSMFELDLFKWKVQTIYLQNGCVLSYLYASVVRYSSFYFFRSLSSTALNISYSYSIEISARELRLCSTWLYVDIYGRSHFRKKWSCI